MWGLDIVVAAWAAVAESSSVAGWMKVFTQVEGKSALPRRVSCLMLKDNEDEWNFPYLGCGMVQE